MKFDKVVDETNYGEVIIGTDETQNFYCLLPEPLDKQVVQGWLHPENIEIVG